MHISMYLASTLLLVGGSVSAQLYTIQLKSTPDVGKTISAKEKDRQAITIRILTPGGQVIQEQKNENITEEEYTQTVLAKNPTRLTRYTRTYTKAIQKQNGLEQTRSFQGCKVDFAWQDGQYKVTGKGLKAADQLALRFQATKQRSNRDQLWLPEQPVAVGSVWPLEAQALDHFGRIGKLDLSQSKGAGKLIRVYDRDGKLFGVIEITLDLVLTRMEKMEFNPPARFRITMVLNTALDGSSTEGLMGLSGKLVGRTGFEQEGNKMLVEMTLELSGTRQCSAEE